MASYYQVPLLPSILEEEDDTSIGPVSPPVATKSFLFLDVEFLEAAINELDVSFMDDICVASGVFHLDDKEKKLYGEIVDDSDDDSTVDLTASVSSNSEELGLDQSSMDDTIEDNFCSRKQGEEALFVVGEHKATRRPSLTRSLSSSLRLSFRGLTVKQVDDTKHRIHVAALRAKLRQQRHENEMMKKQLAENALREKNVAVELQQSTAEIQSIATRLETMGEASRRSLLQEILDEKRAADAQCEEFSKEVHELRAILAMNAKRLDDLQEERNDQAAQALNLELLMTSMGFISAKEDQEISKAIEFRLERDRLRTMLESSVAEPMDDGQSDEYFSRDTTDDKHAEDRFANGLVLANLTSSVDKLENDKNDLSEQLATIQAQIRNLQLVKTQQILKISALEANYAVLTKDELDILNKRTQPVPTRRKFRLPRFFRRKR